MPFQREIDNEVQFHYRKLQFYHSRFERVEVNDEGEYSCTATNVAGQDSARAVLKVRSPPEIIILPRTYLTVESGEDLKVECRATGYPEPQVSIYHSSKL